MCRRHGERREAVGVIEQRQVTERVILSGKQTINSTLSYVIIVCSRLVPETPYEAT